MLSNEEITATLLSHRLAVTAFLATVTRNYHLAEDVFQDVCVKAISREEKFESTEHLLNWVHTVGRNRAIDLLRARDGKYAGLSEEVLQALAVSWFTHHNEKSRPLHESLQYCMQHLTVRNRELLRLRYFEGRSGQEIARHLNRKLETIYQALTRVHRTLADCVRRRTDLVEGDA